MDLSGFCRGGAQWVPGGDNSDHIVLIEGSIPAADGWRIRLRWQNQATGKQMPDHLLSRFLVWDQLHVRIAGGKQAVPSQEDKVFFWDGFRNGSFPKSDPCILKLTFIMGFYFYHFFACSK